VTKLLPFGSRKKKRQYEPDNFHELLAGLTITDGSGQPVDLDAKLRQYDADQKRLHKAMQKGAVDALHRELALIRAERQQP
jgi:hypothetical protein